MAPHLYLVRDEPAPAPAGAPSNQSVYFGDHRVTVWDFRTSSGLHGGSVVPTATITVGSKNGMTVSADLDRNGIAELADILVDLAENYGWDD